MEVSTLFKSSLHLLFPLWSKKENMSPAGAIYMLF
jgi:hypothetical protein